MPLKGINPRPHFTVLEDRADGTHWVLSWSDEEVDGNDRHISINDEGLLRGTLPPRVDFHFYPANTGCHIGRGVRLFVRGGRLGYEMIDPIVTDRPAYARVGVNKEVHEIVIPDTWVKFDDMLAWDEESPTP